MIRRQLTMEWAVPLGLSLLGVAIVVAGVMAASELATLRSAVELGEDAARLRRDLDRLTAIIVFLVAVATFAPIIILGLRNRDLERSRARLRDLESRDVLTLLADRDAFCRGLDLLLNNPERETRGHHALVSVAIKCVNGEASAPGNRIADDLIKCMGGRLLRSVRDIDMVGRLDEHGIVIALADLADAESVAKAVHRIADTATQPYALSGERITCTLAIGVALSPVDGEDAATLMHHSGIALEMAAQESKPCIRFFQADMVDMSRTARLQPSDLRQGLEHDEFEIHYQPQVRLDSGVLCGHEALVRWRHPTKGQIAPGTFVPMAEETGLIVPLGEWILRQACADAAAWPAPRRVAVNLSPVQFQRSNVAALVERVLAETGLAPGELELEITESLFLSHTDAVLGELTKLRDLGVGVALDDFGTGYSSLSYLSRFPITKIKIDRSFMLGLNRDKAVGAIVGCIVSLGRSLDITITAEGVETEAQAELLKALGCDQAQGYLFGRPLPVGELSGRGDRPFAAAQNAADAMHVA